jgi:prolyl-tRNA synthetase
MYMLICRRFYGYPSCKGIKTETERFAGAEETYCIEALMQDGKRFKQGRHISWGRTLQKPDVKFANAEGKQGMFGNFGCFDAFDGTLVMTHSDDKGLVLPPNLAPIQVVIVPIHKTSS